MSDTDLRQTNEWWHPRHDTSQVHRVDSPKSFTDERYHDNYISVIDEFVSSKETAIDIGANIGMMTVPIARRFKKVYAYEPTPSAFTALVKNTESFDNVECNMLAVSDKEGTVNFHFRKGMNTSSVGCIYEGDYIKNTIQVDVIKLDDQNITDVSLIKIDVEGYEANVLNGAKQTILKYNPLICLEYNNREEIDPIMKEYGYVKLKRHFTKEAIFAPKEN